MKGAETDRPFLQMIKPALYSILILSPDSELPNRALLTKSSSY